MSVKSKPGTDVQAEGSKISETVATGAVSQGKPGFASSIGPANTSAKAVGTLDR
jgi:hypothetical protein